jgi:hypothetical protein
MREVFDSINGIPHSEEAAQRLPRRTHSGDSADREFLLTLSERYADAGVDGQWWAQHFGAMIGQRHR